MAAVTGIKSPIYPDVVGIGTPGGRLHPVAFITWSDANMYCRWLGKRLPTSQEWVRALRGGETLPDGSRNPHPRRTVPWADDRRPPPARIADIESPGTAPVGSHPQDRSPDGVMDLAGNVAEWTDTRAGEDFRLIRGGSAFQAVSYEMMLNMTGTENPRLASVKLLDLGLRCVYDPD
jgi:formylglycine-generating enzyme required for sulfatase activity